MSWKDNLENIQFTIITGDGKEYTPLWKDGEKSKDFNIAKFDFINVEGSLVERKKPQGAKFPLTFWFQGDDNIEQSNDFETSANDSRLWTIQHPFYGTIKGQPTNLKRNDKNYGVTEITIEFWESINEDYPNTDISIEDEVQSKVDEINEVAISSYVENAKPETGDINSLKESTTLTSSKFTPDDDNFTHYTNTVSTALKSLDSLITDTETSIANVQQVVNKPSDFLNTVFKNVTSYINAFNELLNTIDNVNSKLFFESQGASILGGMCVSSINGADEYITRTDIEEINTLLVETYNNYLQVLDDNQVEIYDVDNTWIPNPDIQILLLDLITFTSNNLYTLSFNARQERIIELESDSNLIILTHRFLGLDANDENIETFRNINQIKNDELYKVEKGRLIKYFV